MSETLTAETIAELKLRYTEARPLMPEVLTFPHESVTVGAFLVMLTEQCPALLAAAERVAEVEARYKTDGVCEIAAANPNVASYCQEWEQRAERAEAENAELRALLAISYGGTGVYTDDGELHDCRARPHIDFRRDSLAEIGRKMNERARAAARPNP